MESFLLIMLRFKVGLLILCFIQSSYAQERKINFDLPYLSIGTSVNKPFQELNLEVGTVHQFKSKYSIRPSLGINLTSTGGKVYQDVSVTYGAGYLYEVNEYSIDRITRGVLSLEGGYKINEKAEFILGYAAGVLLTTKGVNKVSEGYSAQPIANFGFTGLNQTYNETFRNNYTGLRTGQHFVSLGLEYSLKQWLRLGLRSRIGILDQTRNDLYNDGFVPLSSNSLNLILDF